MSEKDDFYVSKNDFYRYVIKIERRLSRLEVIFYINVFITLVTLLRILLG